MYATKSWDVVAYTYRAETLCPACLVVALTPTGHNTHAATTDTETMLDALARAAGIDRQDEHTYDSGDFPKVIFADQIDGDTCDTCGTGL